MMSVEAISAVDADLARVNAASAQLAAALSHEHVGADAKPNEIQQDDAAIQAAQASLAQAEAAYHADQAAPTTPETPNVTHRVTDPGGIVV